MPRRVRLMPISSPPMRISPESGTSSILMQRSMVDLPEPDAPRIEITSPSFAESETPLRTSREPKLLRRLLTETACTVAVFKFGAPLDMGSFQTWLDSGRASQMWGKPPFESHDDARDGEVEDQIDQASDHEDFHRAKGLRNQFGCKPGDLHHGDDGSKRRRFHHEDDLAAIGGQGLTHRDGKHDAAEKQKAGHSARLRGFHLLVRNGLETAANDLAGIGPGVQGESEDRAPIRFTEERPQAPFLQDRTKLPEPVVDQEDLHEQRCAAEDEHVGFRDRLENTDA